MAPQDPKHRLDGGTRAIYLNAGPHRWSKVRPVSSLWSITFRSYQRNHPYEPVVCKALAINDPAREDRGSEMTPYSPVRTSAEAHKYRIVTANLELRDRSS